MTKYVPGNVIDEAADLRGRGWSWKALGDYFLPRGYGEDAIRRRLDPTYADICNDRRRGRRKRTYGYKKFSGQPISDAELAERRALVPAIDTRDFTGRFFGDPIPGDPRRRGAAA